MQAFCDGSHGGEHLTRCNQCGYTIMKATKQVKRFFVTDMYKDHVAIIDREQDRAAPFFTTDLQTLKSYCQKLNAGELNTFAWESNIEGWFPVYYEDE